MNVCSSVNTFKNQEQGNLWWFCQVLFEALSLYIHVQRGSCTWNSTVNYMLNVARLIAFKVLSQYRLLTKHTFQFAFDVWHSQSLVVCSCKHSLHMILVCALKYSPDPLWTEKRNQHITNSILKRWHKLSKPNKTLFG